MKVGTEDREGFSVIQFDKEDLKNVPPVVLPKPELPSVLVEKIRAALSELRAKRVETGRAAAETP